jgi:hypothetical protein
MPACQKQESWLKALHYPPKERYKDLRKAIAFLKSIKIETREHPPFAPVPDETFFLDVWIENSVIVYRKNSVDVGQLLHEAGHLALTPPSRRSEITPSELSGGVIFGDLVVEAWDYYAAQAAKIFPLVIFAQNFENRGYEVYGQIEKRSHHGVFLLEQIGFLEGDRMVQWQMGEVDLLQNLAAKIALINEKREKNNVKH